MLINYGKISNKCNILLSGRYGNARATENKKTLDHSRVSVAEGRFELSTLRV